MLLRVSDINWTKEQEESYRDTPHSEQVVQETRDSGKIKFSIHVAKKGENWWLVDGICQLGLAKKANLWKVECIDVESFHEKAMEATSKIIAQRMADEVDKQILESYSAEINREPTRTVKPTRAVSILGETTGGIEPTDGFFNRSLGKPYSGLEKNVFKKATGTISYGPGWHIDRNGLHKDVLCLEPNCPAYVPVQGATKDPTKYFCEYHQSNRHFETIPTHDRDLDPIWVNAQYELIKIKNLGDGHLTNIIAMLQRAAKTRCEITGFSDWTKKTGPRYQYLIAEAKARDVECCVRGTRASGGFCSCEQGRMAELALLTANRLLDESKSERQSVRLKVAVVMFTMLLAGGMWKFGTLFITLVWEHLNG